MAKARNQFEQMAREAAQRVDRQRELGEQLALLPDEVPAQGGSAEGRGKGKVTSQMRQWLEARGYQLPEDKLVQMAGLASRQDAVLTAMETAERVLTWAYDVDMSKMPPQAAKVPTPGRRLDVFMQLYTIQLRALDALMPYGAPKATPDVSVTQNTTFVVPAAPSAPADRGDQARDVTPRPGGRMAPPPLPHEIKQNQPLGEDENGGSDA